MTSVTPTCRESLRATFPLRPSSPITPPKVHPPRTHLTTPSGSLLGLFTVSSLLLRSVPSRCPCNDPSPSSTSRSPSSPRLHPAPNRPDPSRPDRPGDGGPEFVSRLVSSSRRPGRPDHSDHPRESPVVQGEGPREGVRQGSRPPTYPRFWVRVRQRPRTLAPESLVRPRKVHQRQVDPCRPP